MKCEKCGSENVVEGMLSTGTEGLLFMSEKARKKILFAGDYSPIKAKGCKDCGAIFDIRMTSPENVKFDN